MTLCVCVRVCTFVLFLELEIYSSFLGVRSRAHFTAGYVQPTAQCTHGLVLPTPEYKPEPKGSFANLVSARVFREEQPAGMNASAAAAYFCFSLIAVNAKPFPFLATLRIDNLFLPPALLPAPGATAALPLTRLFRGTRRAGLLNHEILIFQLSKSFKTPIF